MVFVTHFKSYIQVKQEIYSDSIHCPGIDWTVKSDLYMISGRWRGVEKQNGVFVIFNEYGTK